MLAKKEIYLKPSVVYGNFVIFYTGFLKAKDYVIKESQY